MITHPQADEYDAFYGGYIQRVAVGSDIFVLLSRQPDDLRTLLQNVDDAQANARPAPGEWSIKEVVGHINDAERIFAYRALQIARGDTTPLPGFEQDDYVREADFNARSLSDLLDEFAAQRQGDVICFGALSAKAIWRRGTASDKPISVRGLLYIMAGHVLHHIESLKVDYKVAG